MNSNIPCIVFLLFFSIPGTLAISLTDYSTLEALCIAILVVFISWFIVIIILIICCRKYIENAKHVGDADLDYATAQSNQGYDKDVSGPSIMMSSPKVHPAPHHSCPEVSEKACQTESRYLDPLGPDVSCQTDDESH